jgi:hypothetical protein
MQKDLKPNTIGNFLLEECSRKMKVSTKDLALLKLKDYFVLVKEMFVFFMYL